MRIRLVAAWVAGACGLLAAAPASAQVFGTFPWQMQPYCNVVTLTLTSSPAGFTLDGVDDQCGATHKASAVGVASFSASGQVTLNFTVVAAPTGAPVHVSAVVSPATGQGTWTDSAGHTGTFAFFGAATGLPARPASSSGLPPSSVTSTELAPGAVGAAQINTTQVQSRVTGTCAAGQAVTAVLANGTVSCGAATGSAVDFKVDDHAGEAIPAGMSTVTAWASPVYAVGGTYFPGSGVFRVTASGVYLVTATLGFAANGAATGNRCLGIRAGAAADTAVCRAPATESELLGVTTVVSLAANDEVRVLVANNTGVGTSVLGLGGSSFTVTRLH